MRDAIGRTLVGALALVVAFGASGADKKAEDRKVSANDRHFITQAAEDGMAEVELGKLAQQNGSSAAVKQFGQRMVDDHTRAGKELETTAIKLGINPPKAPGSKHQSDITEFSQLTGDKFDREYADRMVKDHEKAVALFEKQVKSGESKALKAFASKTLPTLQEHLKMARGLASEKK